MFDFLQKKKEEVSLIVDIGNGTITSALVLFTQNSKPQFLYTIKMPFDMAEKPSISKLVVNMSTLLDKTLETLMKDGFKKEYFKGKSRTIDRALITLSSPWFILKTKHLTLEKEKPFLISNSFLNDIITKEENSFKKELSVNTSETSDRSKKDSLEIIEKSIIHTKINGYALNNSIGNKTKVFDAFLCMSAVNSDVVEKILSTILRHAHVVKEKVWLHTFSTVSFSVIRDIFNTDSDFILVDITSEIIDITIIKDDVIVETLTLPSGRNFIIRQIAKRFNVSQEIAESMLHLYILKKADDSVDVGMRDIIVNIEKEWIIYFENAIRELPSGTIVPGKAYITAEYDVASLHLNFLKLLKTNIVYITKENLSHLYQTDYTVPVDQYIAINSIFYNKAMKNR